MPRGGSLGYLAVLALALAIVFASVRAHVHFTPDGVVYARYAARDAGMSDRDATLAARTYYERTPLMRVPRYRKLVELDPSVAFERSRIFANRPLYPALVSLLLPRYGFDALFAVSAVSYVLFAIALYWMLGGLGHRVAAFLFTAFALFAPVTRAVAASDLTDMLALLLWTLWLGTLMRSLRAGTSAARLAVLAITASLLVLTRPELYLIALPALIAAAYAGATFELAASAVAALVFALLTFLTRAYGLAEQLHWMYENIPGANAYPFGVWYRMALGQTIWATASAAVRSMAPIVAAACAIYAYLGGVRREVLVLAGAFVACLLPIPFNPVPDQIGRIVGLPLLPVLCALAQLALARYLGERGALRTAGTRAA